MMGSHRYVIGTSWGTSAIATHFRMLAAALADRGHRVTVLVDGQRRDVESPTTNPAVYAWPSRRPTGWHDAAFLYRLIRRDRVDCTIANFGSVNVMTLVGWLTGVQARVAWYHTLSSAIDADSSLPRWKLRLLRLRKLPVYAAATHVIANSEAARDDACRTFGVPADKCHVFLNSLADPLEHGPCALREPGLVACVGRLHPCKGQDVLVRALARLRDTHPELRVEFVGDGPSRAECERLAAELGVADRCRFVGSVSHDAVFQRMASAAVVVVPSRSEAFGLVNAEALAVGTPVVASRVGGIPEVVRDGVDGFLVPPDDDRLLAERLSLLLSDETLRRQMSGNARQGFLERFEATKCIAEQVRFFERIVERG